MLCKPCIFYSLTNGGWVENAKATTTNAGSNSPCAGKNGRKKKDHGKLKENGLNTWKKEPATANAVAGEGKIAVTAVLKGKCRKISNGDDSAEKN